MSLLVATVVPIFRSMCKATTRTLEHLQECPLLLQMAVLLGHPTWETPWPGVITWPGQAALVERHRQRDLRMWQLSVEISDCPAAEYLMFAQCGKWYLDDPIMSSMLAHTCLLCG